MRIAIGATVFLAFWAYVIVLGRHAAALGYTGAFGEHDRLEKRHAGRANASRTTAKGRTTRRSKLLGVSTPRHGWPKAPTPIRFRGDLSRAAALTDRPRTHLGMRGWARRLDGARSPSPRPSPTTDLVL